jgi:hypothetical protein
MICQCGHDVTSVQVQVVESIQLLLQHYCKALAWLQLVPLARLMMCVFPGRRGKCPHYGLPQAGSWVGKLQHRQAARQRTKSPTEGCKKNLACASLSSSS